MAIELQTNLSLEATPSDPKHVVNIKYVSDFFAGKVKMPVRALSAANIAGNYSSVSMALVSGAVGALVFDGVTLQTGDRVLLIGQNNAEQNGIYVVTNPGDGTTAAELVRADDFNSSDKIYPGVSIAVNFGTLFANTRWKLAVDGAIVLDTTELTFTKVGAVVGTSKHSETITGDNVETEFEIEHNLGTTDVQVSIVNLVTNQILLTDVTIVDSNTINVSFGGPPTPAQVYRVTVIG